MDPEQPSAACGHSVEAAQEYCLECGARILRPRGLAHRLGRAWRRLLPWYPGDWIWPSLAALAIAAGGAAAAVAATGGAGASGTGTILAVSALEPAPPRSTRRAARPGRKGQKQRPSRRTRGLITWPGKNGYTIVLASLPASGGLAAAKAAAEKALGSGLPDVGVLVSASFSSLHPGYYLVFSGVYDSIEEAQGKLPGAQARFRGAYARQVTR